MKSALKTYLIVQTLTMLALCGCKRVDKKKNSTSIEITDSATASYKTASIDGSETSGEESKYENPSAENVAEDAGQFSFDELEESLKDCPELNIEDLSKSVSKKEIESFDDACKYANDILTEGKQVYSGWDWDDYIVSYIQRDDENKLWAAYLMMPYNENDDVIIIGGNHIVVFSDDGEIIRVWYNGS